MPRYELVEGTSSKFWEIALSGRGFTVCFGRLGGEGRSQTKTFTTAAEAKAQHDGLVADKVKKGYRLGGAKKAAAPAKKSAAPPADAPAGKLVGGSIAETGAGIEAYFDALRGGGFELTDAVLPPQPAVAIADIEKKLSTSLPADVKAFLSRGLRAGAGSLEDGERFAGIGFDWLGAKKIVTSTTMLRKIAADTIDDEDDPHAKIVRAGVALTWSEPQIVVADAVYHFSFRNPVLRVADSFGEFLSAWLAAGCFGSHDFDLLWRRVKAQVPAGVPPAKNPWVKAYKKQFPGLSKG